MCRAIGVVGVAWRARRVLASAREEGAHLLHVHVSPLALARIGKQVGEETIPQKSCGKWHFLQPDEPRAMTFVYSV